MENTTKNTETNTAPASVDRDAEMIDDLEAEDPNAVIGGQSGIPTGVTPGIMSPRDPASRS